ncbi:MAG: hypothetical protein QOI74_2320 [Micromonosporaceae bacterium]|nr:hypothetical protein [Micromonosporaceae bacterium]
MFATTETVWVHWALSLAVAAPAREKVPVWAWPVTELPAAPQDQPVTPDSKPGLVITTFAALAAGMTNATVATAAASPVTAARTGLRMGCAPSYMPVGYRAGSPGGDRRHHG